MPASAQYAMVPESGGGSGASGVGYTTLAD